MKSFPGLCPQLNGGKEHCFDSSVSRIFLYLESIWGTMTELKSVIFTGRAVTVCELFPSRIASILGFSPKVLSVSKHQTDLPRQQPAW